MVRTPVQIPPLSLRDTHFQVYKQLLESVRPVLANRYDIDLFVNQGCMALAVGLDKQDPKKVIKLCRWGDPFLVYARLIMSGAFKGNDSALRIHELNRVEDSIWRVGVEKLMIPDSKRVNRISSVIMDRLRWNCYRRHSPIHSFSDRDHKDLFDIALNLANRGYGHMIDMNFGNIMSRSDGTLVLHDPLA